MIKTITYNPETHVLVPREPSNEMCDAVESLLAENERLNHNLTSTEQTMRDYQELAAKRLEEIERLKEIEMAGEIMRDLLKQRDEMLSICAELQESAEYWSEYDVPLGIVDRLKAAIDSVKGGA